MPRSRMAFQQLLSKGTLHQRPMQYKIVSLFLFLDSNLKFEQKFLRLTIFGKCELVKVVNDEFVIDSQTLTSR